MNYEDLVRALAGTVDEATVRRLLAEVLLVQRYDFRNQSTGESLSWQFVPLVRAANAIVPVDVWWRSQGKHSDLGEAVSPCLVASQGGSSVVIDGNHRLARTKLTEYPAIVLTEKESLRLRIDL